jgi:glycosyltransferase involved in cell wall biosynthesis
MKVALVHDWLLAKRGGEKVLAELCDLFPEAPIYTLIYLENDTMQIFKSKRIYTSICQKFPFIKKYYRYLLPFYPTIIEQFNLSNYDIVISLSHCVAKGVITPPHCYHISYCFTPMRYIWDQYWQYFPKNSIYNILTKSFIFNYLRIWDVISSQRVNLFIAISNFVASRIKKYYNREAKVVYPPIDTRFFVPSNDESNFFLIVSALVPYKNIRIAIEAFNEVNLPLKIIGQGPQKRLLKKIARKNIEFIDWVNDEKLKNYYQNCRALIIPNEEDFGLVSLEAQACGKPVIVYSKGGALETIIQGQTGLVFGNASKYDIINTLKDFEKIHFDKSLIRKHAENFSRDSFRNEFTKLINQQVK